MPIFWEPLRLTPEPQRLLFVAPHVGGGAAIGRNLARSLPDDWAAYGLVLPGRERLTGEPVDWAFDATVNAAADGLTEIAAQSPDAVTVGLGQCSGAWLMYAILARAASDPGSRADLMVVVSQGAWHLPRVHPELPASSEELWDQLVAAGDVHPAVAEDEDAREILEPVLRADYAAVAGFPYTADPLKVPLLAIIGSEDRHVDRAVAQSWADYGPRLDVAEVSAGHYPVQENPGAVVRAVVERVHRTW